MKKYKLKIQLQSIPSSGCQKMSSCSYANLIVVAIKSSYDGKVPCLLNREV